MRLLGVKKRMVGLWALRVGKGAGKGEREGEGDPEA